MHGLIFETSVCYWQNQPGCYLGYRHSTEIERQMTTDTTITRKQKLHSRHFLFDNQASHLMIRSELTEILLPNELSLATSASIPETKWVLMLFIGSILQLPHRLRICCERFIVVMLPLQPNGEREFSVRHDTWLLSWSVLRKQSRCQTSTPNLKSLIT